MSWQIVVQICPIYTRSIPLTLCTHTVCPVRPCVHTRIFRSHFRLLYRLPARCLHTRSTPLAVYTHGRCVHTRSIPLALCTHTDFLEAYQIAVQYALYISNKGTEAYDPKGRGKRDLALWFKGAEPYDLKGPSPMSHGGPSWLLHIYINSFAYTCYDMANSHV